MYIFMHDFAANACNIVQSAISNVNWVFGAKVQRHQFWCNNTRHSRKESSPMQSKFFQPSSRHHIANIQIWFHINSRTIHLLTCRWTPSRMCAHIDRYIYYLIYENISSLEKDCMRYRVFVVPDKTIYFIAQRCWWVWEWICRTTRAQRQSLYSGICLNIGHRRCARLLLSLA